MPYPHSIRLRGPWDYEPLARSAPASALEAGAESGQSEPADLEPVLPPPGRVKMPTDWGDSLGAEFFGRVRYCRRFNRPRGLEPHESVWLVLDGADGWADISLNGEPLGRAGGYALAARFDVTESLAERNELIVDVTLPHPDAAGEQALRAGCENLPGGLVGEVRLEIRAAHWLDDLWLESPRNDTSTQLHLGGKSCGQERGESLTLVVDGPEGELVAAEVETGATFDLSADVSGLPDWPPAPNTIWNDRHNVRVCLIGTSTAYWKRSFTMAGRALAWNAAERELRVAGAKVPVPVERVSVSQLTDAIAFARWAAPFSGRAIGCEAVLPEAYYNVLDALGVRLLQSIPPHWAAAVCPPRAHHPSIVAWVVPEDAVEPLEAQLPARGGGRRPWIARQVAFGA